MNMGSDNKNLVCIVGYNRLDSILALINKVLECMPSDWDIIVSLDKSISQDDICTQIKKVFPNKVRVIAQDENLGLKKHIIKCGNYLNQYDYDVIMLLEDDLDISFHVFSFVESALCLANDSSISGISLYSYRKDEMMLMPFYPKQDGYDNYYLQYPSSWGQVWTKSMWNEFHDWLLENDCQMFQDPLLPINVNHWPVTSWKKHFLRYMVHNNKYFLYPRVSLTNNLCMDGENHSNIGNVWSVCLLDGNKEWSLSYFPASKSIYDCHFQELGNENVKVKNKKEALKSFHNEMMLSWKSYLYLAYISIRSKFND